MQKYEVNFGSYHVSLKGAFFSNIIYLSVKHQIMKTKLKLKLV